MKKQIKAISFVLVLAMVLPFASACGKKESYDFTMWVVQIDSAAAGINFGDSPAFKKLETVSGKKVKIIMGTDYNMLLSTKSYPEVVVWGGYPGGYDKGIADGVVTDLTDLINEHAPNYKKLLTDNPEIFKTVSTSDGRIGAMYEINDKPEGPWYGYYMRKDILDAYGEDVPVTYDDWARIFDKVQAGKEGVAKIKNPLYISCYGVDILDFLNAGYDVVGGGSPTGGVKRMLVDDQIEFGPLMSGHKEYIQMMNTWYSKKYISQGFSLGAIQILPPLADVVGTPQSPATVMAFPYTSSYEVLESTAASLGISGYELVPVPHPRKTGEEDKQLHVNCKPGYIGTSMVITDKATPEQAVDIVKWFDYLYSEEGSLLMNFGTEGDTYTMENGIPKFTQKILADPVFNRYKYASSNFPTLRMRVTDESLLSEQAKEAQGVWSENNDGAYNISFLVSLSADKAAGAALKETTYIQYYVEEVVKFINNSRALSQYDSFITQMNNYGATEVTNLYQEAYESYNEKQLPASWSAT